MNLLGDEGDTFRVVTAKIIVASLLCTAAFFALIGVITGFVYLLQWSVVLRFLFFAALIIGIVGGIVWAFKVVILEVLTKEQE